MTQRLSENLKKRESLRCLFASVASMEVIDWLLESDEYRSVIASTQDIDRRLINIRSFFLAGWGLTRAEVEHNFIPMGSLLMQHVYGVLFSDAVRWWAAAHRSRQDENKYLRDAMYKGDFDVLRHHFYHEFRNRQLAHYPGGMNSNDNPLLTPAPYGFPLTLKEVDDFRGLLAHSIKLTFGPTEELDRMIDQLNELIETSDVSSESKAFIEELVRSMLNESDRQFLKLPTRNYLSEKRSDEPD